MQVQRPSLTEEIRFRGPPGLLAALSLAAGRDYTTASEFARRAIVAKLRELGIEPSALNDSRDDGARTAAVG